MTDSFSGRKESEEDSCRKGIRSSDLLVNISSDEFSESKDSSVYKSSEEYFEYSCDPCSTAGDKIEAQGFCTDCEEYVCGMCLKGHSRGKATRNHRLLDKDNMPQKTVKTFDPCKTVGDKIDAMGYCDECEEYLFSNCFRSHSRSKATRGHNLMNRDCMPEKYNIVSLHKECDAYKNYSYLRDINVKATNDDNIRSIIAMSVVSNTEIVLLDFDNKSLKLVDIESNVIKARSTLDFEPELLRVTTVSKDNIAVLSSKFPETSESVTVSEIYTIQIITIAENLFVHRSIKLTGTCEDIEYRNGYLYTSFQLPVSFQVLHLSGAVYRTINPDSEVLKHCKAPRRIAVSPDSNLIYVSDWKTKKIIGIDMDGQLIYVYKHEIPMPDGIAICPFGFVYICDRQQSVVYKMKQDLNEANVVLGPDDGLFGPEAICFSAEKQHLYISIGCDEAKDCNLLKVFKCQ